MIHRTYGGALGPMNSYSLADQKHSRSRVNEHEMEMRISESQVSSSYKANHSHIAVKVPVLEDERKNFDRIQYDSKH